MMFSNIRGTKRGFTLIELLVVIAIIGILSAVVLASLQTARQKARDAKRISDIGQIALALELVFDASQSYPISSVVGYCGNAASQGGTGFIYCVPHALVANRFMAATATDPQQVPGSNFLKGYRYVGIDSVTSPGDCTSGESCPSYYLGATLERTDNNNLTSDTDSVLTSGTIFSGLGNADCVTSGTAQPGGTEQCYDVKP